MCGRRAGERRRGGIPSQWAVHLPGPTTGQGHWQRLYQRFAGVSASWHRRRSKSGLHGGSRTHTIHWWEVRRWRDVVSGAGAGRTAIMHASASVTAPACRLVCHLSFGNEIPSLGTGVGTLAGKSSSDSESLEKATCTGPRPTPGTLSLRRLGESES